MRHGAWWITGVIVISACIWFSARAQSPEIVVPFATTPLLVHGTNVDQLFGRKLDGSYVGAGFGFSNGYPLISGMGAFADLLSSGVANLLAGAPGPPGVGIVSQMTAFGKFTFGGG